MIRAATPEDAEALARLHVEAWAETYPGLMPEAEIARHDLAYRLDQWPRILASGQGRVVIAPGFGFAMMGPQRYDQFAVAYPEELYSLYLLRSAQGRGLGRDLFRAVSGAEPFTALVIAGNDRACGFYEAQGGRHLGTFGFEAAGEQLEEHTYGFAPFA